MRSIFQTVMKMPTPLHGFCAVAAFAGLQIVKGRLDASYAASKHPVDYMTGQTGFSAQTVKEYYAHMQAEGTLEIYVTTQLIDYAFIAAIFCMGLFVCTFIARAGREGSWGRRIGILAGVALMAGAVSDAIENAWSFVMLADPAGFANWLAIAYSSFAVVKFALITCAMLLVIVSLLLSLIGRLSRKARLGKS
ncbi:MAG: hypothetical protein ABJJ53_18350 [Sulfitobacter sp.]